MEYEKFVKLIHEVKTDSRETGSYDIKLVSNKEHTRQTIKRDYICKSCKTHIIQGVTVYFKKYQRLTIYEAGLLYALFVLKKKPLDYGQYHKCIAGKKFIENIEKVI